MWMDRRGRNVAASPLRIRVDLHRSTATSVLASRTGLV